MARAGSLPRCSRTGKRVSTGTLETPAYSRREVRQRSTSRATLSRATSAAAWFSSCLLAAAQPCKPDCSKSSHAVHILAMAVPTSSFDTQAFRQCGLERPGTRMQCLSGTMCLIRSLDISSRKPASSSQPERTAARGAYVRLAKIRCPQSQNLTRCQFQKRPERAKMYVYPVPQTAQYPTR